MEAVATAHLMALGHRLVLATGRVQVVAGGEIASVHTLLERLLLSDKVVTLDALHTQRQTAQRIQGAGTT